MGKRMRIRYNSHRNTKGVLYLFTICVKYRYQIRVGKFCANNRSVKTIKCYKEKDTEVHHP